MTNQTPLAPFHSNFPANDQNDFSNVMIEDIATLEHSIAPHE
jgi:hypothetical protein